MISCDLHDHIEIICMRRYQVVVHLLDGQKLRGIACDTRTAAAEELLQLDQNGQNIDIRLLQIHCIDVLDKTAPAAKIWLQGRQGCDSK